MTDVARTPILAMDVTTEVVVPLEDTVKDTVKDTGSTSKRWVLFGSSCPKAEIVFFLLYTVTVVSIYNLTKTSGNSNLWTALLSSSLGYLLPNPTLNQHVV